MKDSEITIKLAPRKKLFLITANELWNKANLDLAIITRQAAVQVCNQFNELPLLELSIKLTDDKELHQLNKDFRGQDKPTNILSFPSDEATKEYMPGYLGDIAISYERLEEEAIAQKKLFKNHYTHLIIHGILHLLGYDHDNEQKATIMEQFEIALLKELGIPNPYHVKKTIRLY